MQKTIICNENAINRVKYADKIEKTVDFQLKILYNIKACKIALKWNVATTN